MNDMQYMMKVINPVMCDVNGKKVRAYAKIKFVDGNLRITGVIGPMRNGNCKGSCGQCVDEIREGKPTEGWTEGMVQEFCDIWDKWHLNDMRPYCQHQKDLGWDKLADKKVMLYNYKLTRDAYSKKRAAKDAAMKALERGESFTPTQEQVKYTKLPYSITTSAEISGEDAVYYEPKKPIFAGDTGATSTKLLGFLREDEHPDGILCRACPVCGYKYGTSWIKEEVPPEVIAWLFELPDAEAKPAWV